MTTEEISDDHRSKVKGTQSEILRNSLGLMMRGGSKPGAFLRPTLLLWHEEQVTKERSWRGKRHIGPFRPGLPFFPFGYTLRG